MFNFLKKTLWGNVALISISVFCYFVALGITTVSLPVILDTNDVSKTLIGFSDNMKIISGLIALLVLPILARKMGIVMTGLVSLCIYAATLLLLPIYQNYSLWIVLISLMGIGFVVFRTMEETLVNVIADNKNRGRIMGITSSAMLGGIAVGPMITRFLGVTCYASFVTAFIFVVISGLLFFLLRGVDGEVKPSKRINVIRFVKEQPLVFLTKFTLEFFIQVIFLFVVIYAMQEGYKPEIGGMFIAFFSLSGLFNCVTGVLVDKIRNRNITMVFGALLMFAIIELLPFAIAAKEFTYALFFMFGLLGGGMIFLSTMSILNSSYKKEDLVSANSALTVTDSIGMISAGIFTGLAMDKFGYIGFYIPMAALGGIYLIALGYLIATKKVDFKSSHLD